MPWWMNCRFQGSHTQKQSMVPTFMLATICGGGTVMVSMSLSGWIPPAARHWGIHRAWGHPGGVLSALVALPRAFFVSSAALKGLASTPTFTSAYSLATEMHWPFRLRRARMYMGVGTLFCVTLPALIR